MFMKTSVHRLGGVWYKSSIYAGKKTWQLFTLSKMILILLSLPSATWTGRRRILAKARGRAPHSKKANSPAPGRSCAEDSRNPSVSCHGNSPQTNWYTNDDSKKLQPKPLCRRIKQLPQQFQTCILFHIAKWPDSVFCWDFLSSTESFQTVCHSVCYGFLLLTILCGKTLRKGIYQKLRVLGDSLKGTMPASNKHTVLCLRGTVKMHRTTSLLQVCPSVTLCDGVAQIRTGFPPV